MSEVECGHLLHPSKSQLKKNWVIIHLSLYCLWGFCMHIIAFRSRDFVLANKCLSKRKKPQDNHMLCLKTTTTTTRMPFPLLLGSWRKVDRSSCLLQLSNLPYDLGQCVAKCVFCGGWVEVFGSCMAVTELAAVPPDLPVYGRWPVPIPAAQLSRACSARSLTSAGRRGWQEQTDNISHRWLTFKENTHGSGTEMPAPR